MLKINGSNQVLPIEFRSLLLRCSIRIRETLESARHKAGGYKSPCRLPPWPPNTFSSRTPSQPCTMAARHFPSWADLHPELLGLVIGRLPLADRVRLGAACRPWRRAARQEPLPPPLPWLTLLDGTFLSIPGGEVHRMPIPEEDASCYGSMGNWLLLRRSVGEFSLANPFSGDAVRLPEIACPPGSLTSVKPMPLSTSTPDLSPDSSPFAVLTKGGGFRSEISVCRPGTTAATAFSFPVRERISDVAFFDGKLYALSFGKLFVLDLETTGSTYLGKPRRSVPSMKRVAGAVDDPWPTCRSIAGERYVCAYWSYLVESSGKLLQVRRLIGCLATLPKEERVENSRTLSFEVFEADLVVGKWRRVDDLGGHQALFVATQSSMSLPAPECGAREDCIYFVCDYDIGNWEADPLRDCGVFDMRTGTITPLLPDGVVVRRQGRRALPAWFFPTKAM